MTTRITGISSMATRQVLAELVRCYQQREATDGIEVAIESVGGVDAAKRVQAGEAFDVVVLASDAIERLVSSGHVVAGSALDWVRSPVAVAVPRGAPRPDIASEAGVRAAIRAARRIGYSTGPSGTHLQRLFERWGLATELAARTVQASPGVPVGALVARGEVDLGFQQLSELMNLEGVDVVGLLPREIEFITRFTGGLGVAAREPDAAHALLQFMASPETAEVKRRHGMEPA